MTVAEEIAPGATLQTAAAVKPYADIARCESPDHLDAICKLVWAVHFANELPEQEATFLAACIPLWQPLLSLPIPHLCLAPAAEDFISLVCPLAPVTMLKFLARAACARRVSLRHPLFEDHLIKHGMAGRFFEGDGVLLSECCRKDVLPG
ncbi:hypothetical protein BcanWSM471_06925 [Bradyrhizobium sp. WSM471]|uniref:hypothetical protein n=1 Tax=Bradyrhizobium sp. WSM471 TaxID=319017 RepID=UPI00024D2345|nr:MULTISPECIES: hypothetical protein [Bradyrhizobium]EHR00823.1 hypothetical protein Bra471DRAFT_01418 [Bradyrhizobium sp. WSM471]UFW42902.1 hypothetical protein BcanWSM471_06925 [Bradyrhizobium canariense]